MRRRFLVRYRVAGVERQTVTLTDDRSALRSSLAAAAGVQPEQVEILEVGWYDPRSVKL